jgi:hypothetical protein
VGRAPREGPEGRSQRQQSFQVIDTDRELRLVFRNRSELAEPGGPLAEGPLRVETSDPGLGMGWQL